MEPGFHTSFKQMREASLSRREIYMEANPNYQVGQLNIAEFPHAINSNCRASFNIDFLAIKASQQKLAH